MKPDDLEELDEARAKERDQEKQNSFLINLENEIGILGGNLRDYREEQRTLERLCNHITDARMRLQRIYDKLTEGDSQ